MLKVLIQIAVNFLTTILYFSWSTTLLIEESHYFILRHYLVTIFSQFYKILVKHTRQVETKLLSGKCNEIIYVQWDPNTGERWCCLYLNLSMLLRGGLGPLSYIKWNKLFVTIVIASSHWLLLGRAPS